MVEPLRQADALQQLHRRGLAHQAIRVTDDGDFLAAFDRARHRHRAHHGTHRVEDDVARVAQPDELFLRHAEHRGEEFVQPRVNARERNHRQFIGEIVRVQARFRVARDLLGSSARYEARDVELLDPEVQRERFEDQVRQGEAGDDEAMAVDEDFLTAMEYAMPPSGGMGMGIDRLLMALTGLGIRETILFPLVKPQQ